METSTSISNSSSFDEKQIQKWVAEAQQGNENAFARIVEVFTPKLYVLIYRVLLDWDESRDVMQEAFIRAYQALPRYKPRSKFQSWLFQIACRHALETLRRKKRRPEHLNLHKNVPEIGKNDPAVYRNEISQAIENAIDQLQPELKMAFVLSEYEGQSYRQIAEIIGGTVKSVEMKIYHARLILREQLKSYQK